MRSQHRLAARGTVLVVYAGCNKHSVEVASPFGHVTSDSKSPWVEFRFSIAR
jgi:hypothetical protein